MKQQQVQQQAQQNQAQQSQQTQAGLYFVTFPERLTPDRAKTIVAELRRRFQGFPVFCPKPPRGRKIIVQLNEITVIVTFPHTESPKQEQDKGQEQEQDKGQAGGFTLRELIRNKS
jgi:hypothetical protein